ncbi:MAG: hypothetical protein GPJ50_03175 [Candidatus Heimdallarchaeota archaeon]|nr:hypothetical protein [Candidatus Heimdallarchaeota archaeon]
MKVKRSKDNFDFLRSIILLIKPDKPASFSCVIKNRIKEWSEAGICPYVPISSSCSKEQLHAFIKEYSKEGT